MPATLDALAAKALNLGLSVTFIAMNRQSVADPRQFPDPTAAKTKNKKVAAQ